MKALITHSCLVAAVITFFGLEEGADFFEALVFRLRQEEEGENEEQNQEHDEDDEDIVLQSFL